MVVSKLWRYPVKSMLGEQCERVQVGAQGVEGDRAYAVRDPEGKLGSGKNSDRHRRIDGLFGFAAAYRSERLEIAFPDGRRLRGDDPRIHDALSAALGTPVTLAREADVSHKDASPLHLVTTASLAWLAAALPGAKIDERRFRPNIVVDSSEMESNWIGRTLAIGGVRLRVTSATGRCRMTTLAQSDLPDDPAVLRCIAQEADADFGVYADVVTPGTVTRNDKITLL